jgi:hypothetical protein
MGLRRFVDSRLRRNQKVTALSTVCVNDLRQLIPEFTL